MITPNDVIGGPHEACAVLCTSLVQLFQELMKNSDFSAIVSYQEQAREKSLKDLLDLPYTRVSLGEGQGKWLQL